MAIAPLDHRRIMKIASIPMAETDFALAKVRIASL
jgi:hypothetical protein